MVFSDLPSLRHFRLTNLRFHRRRQKDYSLELNGHFLSVALVKINKHTRIQVEFNSF